MIEKNLKIQLDMLCVSILSETILIFFFADDYTRCQRTTYLLHHLVYTVVH